MFHRRIDTVHQSGGRSKVDRDGGWMSLANMRRALRAALPDDLAWVTPHSFRRTVASVVRDARGPASASAATESREAGDD